MDPASFIFHRACDKDQDCRNLHATAFSDGPEHLFMSLLSRLPDKHAARISDFFPEQSSKRKLSPTDRAIAAQQYIGLKEYLRVRRSDIFGWDKTSACCTLHAPEECRVHFDRGASDDKYKPLTISIAGPTCTPWTQLGASLQTADIEQFHYLLYYQELVELGYDFAHMENSRYFPVELFAEELTPSHHVISCDVCAESCTGFPVVRRRQLCSAVRKETLVWVGPTTPAAVKEDFYNIFGVRVMLDPDAFVGIDDSISTRASLREISGRRCSYPVDDKKLLLSKLLSPHQKRHYDEYMQMLEKGTCARGFLSGSFTVDLTQHPKRASSGAFMPPLQTGSVMVNLTAPASACSALGGHIYTANELAFSHGWPTIAYPQNAKYLPAVGFDLTTAAPTWSKQTRLLGNGIHLPAVSAWLLYVHSNCIRRDVLNQMTIPITWSDAINETDEDE